MEILLTVKEAVPVLKMSQQAIYAAIRAHQLPDKAIHRFGRRIRLDLSVLDRAAAKNAKSNGSKADDAA